VERYPVIVYFGAAVLAWTAAKMIASEPMVLAALEGRVPLQMLLYITVVAGVLLAGFAHNHRRLESRIHARIAALGAQRVPPAEAFPPKEGSPMQTVLVPIGPARNVTFAIRRIVDEYRRNPGSGSTC
jgi:hypothetical protein